MKFLEDNNIRLRPLEPEDLEILYQWENDTELWFASDSVAPYSRYVLREYLKTSHQDIFETRQLRLVIENKKDNKAVGLIDLFDYEPLHLRAGIGVLIHAENNRKQGFATAALNLFIDYCFNVLMLHQVYCNVGQRNQKSLNMFLKTGFEIVGTKQQWRKTTDGWEDEIIMQKINKASQM